MTAVLMEEGGIKEVAVTHTNNDYGKGLATASAQLPEAAGSVTIAQYEDGKADYLLKLAHWHLGGDRLVVAGYVDQGGAGIICAALDTGRLIRSTSQTA